MKADLQAWALGFEEIRRRAAARLSRVWSTPRAARAIMHQNVSGGAASLVRRHEALRNLSDWWDSASSNLALLSGPEGVGKTWTAVGWAVDRCDDLPIVLLLPASAVASLGEARATSVLRLLGEQFYEASGGLRDVAHWEARVRRTLLRPVADGPTIALIIDGLNQQPDTSWEKLFTTLQDEPFVGRIRVLGTVRPIYLADRLGGLRRLIDRPSEINLGPFDDAELDERLALAGMQRDQLNTELLQLARTPRLFELVAKYHNSPDGGEMTLHRLLWEYGRDEEGRRRERSFSDDEWRAWLASLAEHFRAGVIEVTRRDLAASVERADLGIDEIKARLDDIVDGHLTEESAPGRSRF